MLLAASNPDLATCNHRALCLLQLPRSACDIRVSQVMPTGSFTHGKAALAKLALSCVPTLSYWLVVPCNRYWLLKSATVAVCLKIPLLMSIWCHSCRVARMCRQL